MSDAVSVRGVVVAHGAMAQGMVDAVRCIAGGAADALEPLSNNGKSPVQLKEDLDAVAGEGPVLVFVDLQRGSCGMAALSCCKDKARRVVVSGVNLPMLLDFVFHKDLPMEELVARSVNKGRAAIDRPLIPG
jgi:mannose/fructose-specific phosphotransferase system component IIA